MLTPDYETALCCFREQLEQGFSPDTAVAGSPHSPPSAGHCAAAAICAYKKFGGTFVSAVVHGQSHWFNRLCVDGRQYDVDFTADQFGHVAPAIGEVGCLYPGTRERQSTELNAETISRAYGLARASGL